MSAKIGDVSLIVLAVPCALVILVHEDLGIRPSREEKQAKNRYNKKPSHSFFSRLTSITRHVVPFTLINAEV